MGQVWMGETCEEIIEIDQLRDSGLDRVGEVKFVGEK